MRLNHLLPAFFLLTFICTASGQEYSYARYDVKDGLAGSVVYHGVEDKEGFLWFATETGVSRFDGTHFRNFTKADGLPDNEIIKLFVDSKGRVWMMPFRNSICYYWKGKIYNPENDSLLKRLPIAGRITNMAEDNNGNLLLTGSTAFYVITARHEIHTISSFFDTPFHVGDAGFNAAGHIISDVVLFGQYNSTFMIEFDRQGTVHLKKKIPEKYSFWMAKQSTFYSDSLLIRRYTDSLIFETDGRKVRKAIALPETFNNLSMLGNFVCAINTGNGAFFYNIRSGKIDRHVLPGTIVNTVFRDHEGNTWLTTNGKGIFRVGSFEFNNFRLSENGKNERSVFSIYKADSLLYAGSENSLLFIINLRHQTFRHQYVFKSISSRILAFVPFPPGYLFMGTDQGFAELHTQKIRTTIRASIKSLKACGDSLLAAVEYGLIMFSSNGYNIPFKHKEARTTCAYAQNNIYYYGTLNGLYAMNRDGVSVWLGEKHSLLRGRITDIEEGPDSTLWIATHGEGIVGYKDGKIIHTVRQKDGMTSDICRNVFIAGSDVWVGTDRGLNRIQLNNGQYKVTTFTSADGLLADIINAIYVDSTQVYVGTPAGLTTFDANKISLNSYCKLRLTGIQAMGQGWTHDTTGFALPPSGNAIRFDYVGISYRSAGDITYRYRLMGLDDDWQTTRETFLSYPSLPSGNYELQIIATNKFGVESDTTHIPFVVEKHLWEKTWFRILVLLLAATLIWFFVNARIKKIRRQNDEKVQINNRITELEQMALKAQMNPHFIFNSLNSVQQYVIDKDLRGANKFITEFSRLIRLTLDISSKTKISLYEEISYLSTYLELEKTKFEDKFSYSVMVDPAMDTSDWFMPPMILQPYVENSIRHGVRYRMDKLGHIKLSFRLNGQYLICQVEDNGVGRKKAGEYKSEIAIEYQSKGMTLTAKRIEMLNKNQETPVLIDIEDMEANNIPAGTRVTLQFPVQDAGSSI